MMPAASTWRAKSLLGGCLEGGWRAVVGQGRTMKKTLSNAILSYLSTATWRVFGKSIYTECGKTADHKHKKKGKS